MFDDQHPSSSSPPQPPAKRTERVYSNCPMNSHEESYLDSESADIHFVFGSAGSDSALSERVPAHKVILARDSNVFEAMFCGAMKKEDDIHLTDVTEAAFKEFLQFFYLGIVELSIEHLADVMNLGHKYNVTNCTDFCIKFFKEVHNAANILIGLGIGIRHGHSEFMTLCERFIVRKTNAVLKSDGFLECDRQLLAHILNANLFVCSEVELFEACMRWVKVKSGHDILSKAIVDEHLGELFYNIRFGFMTIGEFCILLEKYDAVLSNDSKIITKLIGLPHIQQGKFNTQSRQIKWSDPSGVVIIKCDRENDRFGEWDEADRMESIKFTTGKELLLTGFTINRIGKKSPYHHKDAGDDYDDLDGDVEVKIYEYDDYDKYGDVNVVLKINAKVLCDKSTHIPLTKPIFLKTQFFAHYEISIEFPVLYEDVLMYCSKALKGKVEVDSGEVIQFLDDKAYKHNEDTYEIISALEFNRV